MTPLTYHLLLVVLAVGVATGGSDQNALGGGSNGGRASRLTHTQQEAAVAEEGEEEVMGVGILTDMAANISVPVCCGLEQVFNMSKIGCEPSHKKPVISFHYEDGQPVEYQFAYKVKAGFPNCTFYNLQPDVGPEDTFYLLPDGQLLVPSNADRKMAGDKFCLLSTGEHMEAIVCFPDMTESSFDRVVYQTLYPVGLIISAVFLAATLLAYCLVVELRDLLGRCLMCSVFALCVAQTSTVIVQMATHLLSMTACVIIAVFMHFWYLSAFLWLNVICFNVFLTIWWKSDAAFGRLSRWFAIYSAYAWGLAVLITSVALARDFSEGLQDSSLPKPNFGQGKCWFSGDEALIIFFYGPTSVILGINVVLFCASAYKLCSLNKSTEARMFQFSLYLKLFVLMGVTWIFEAISFFVQRETKNSSGNYVWLVFDLINIMQGLIIFLVFVCRRAVLVRLCEVLCGVSYAKTKFPTHYQNTEVDLTNNEIKHSVI
ncbi:G-protein coupled receptor Mth2-like isoform X2 [Homarus americanus]|uniref:G-protein coupled receptor Mth2-like isoform X2 n=1 Tax=Homarus americanus TaxID=6706 RepID=UPI001C44AA50|nr:G-protein coupled receptor Mth2-like isoform X2 [Homarus americanus]